MLSQYLAVLSMITEAESGETEMTRDVATTGEAAEGGEESIPVCKYRSTSVLNLANESGKLLNVLLASVSCLSPSWCERRQHQQSLVI